MLSREMERHFSAIAHKYEFLKTADIEPMLLIKEKLDHMETIRAADVGCGTGRYDIALANELGDRLHLVCIDNNENMLRELRKNLVQNNVTNFETLLASATDLPLEDGSLDAVVTFNAVHHFDIRAFLGEAARVLRPGGLLFIYTRLREQNARNIWGRFFPGFLEKETRLYELDELRRAFEATPALRLEAVKEFRYSRLSRLDDLLEQARNHHYSTFHFYDEREFKEALEGFKRNILERFDDPDHIEWEAENTMLIARRVG